MTKKGFLFSYILQILDDLYTKYITKAKMSYKKRGLRYNNDRSFIYDVAVGNKTWTCQSALRVYDVGDGQYNTLCREKKNGKGLAVIVRCYIGNSQRSIMEGPYYCLMLKGSFHIANV